MSEPKSPAAIERELRDAFKLFDRDGSGTITSDEFTAILTRPGGGKPFTIDEDVLLDEEVGRRADLLPRIRDAVQLHDLAHVPQGTKNSSRNSLAGLARRRFFHPG